MTALLITLSALFASGLHSADGYYLMGAGTSAYGELGTMTTSIYKKPVKVASSIRQISACKITGQQYVYYVDNDSNLYVMYGNGGAPSLLSNNVKCVSAGADGRAAWITNDGALYYWGAKICSSDVVSVSAGYQCCLFIKTDGTLWAYGNNDFGALGNITATTPVQIDSDVTACAAGMYHSLYVKRDGTLMGMGNAYYGALLTTFDGSNHSQLPPTQIDTDVVAVDVSRSATVYVKQDGSLMLLSRFTRLLIDSNADSACVGDGSDTAPRVLYVKNDKTLWGWGYDGSGILGDGTCGGSNGCIAPTQIDADVKSAAFGTINGFYIKSDGTLMGTGDGIAGLLGVSRILKNPANPVMLASGVTKIASGSSFNLYLTADGTLYKLGGINPGTGTVQAGDAIAPVEIATNIAAMAAARDHFLYLTTDGVLYATGDNYFGQLGVDLGQDANGRAITYTDTPQRVATGVASMATGYSHSLYVTTGGILYAMGEGNYGALGVDLDTKPNSSGVISTNTPQLVTTGVKAVAAGDAHSLFLTTDGTLFAMGYNGDGQLGVNLDLGTDVYGNAIIITSKPQKVATSVAAISAGYAHSLYLTTDGTLYVMGANYDGQLGVDLDLGTDSYGLTITHTSTPQKVAAGVAAIAACENYSMYVTTGGTLYAMGRNLDGRFGVSLGRDSDGHKITQTSTPVKVAENVVAIATGDNNSLYLTSSYVSPYWPNYKKGGKWSDAWGWIDDTFFPWVYSYGHDNWFYVYGETSANVNQGYWIAYLTSDGKDCGWGYVYPSGGWYCCTSDNVWHWVNFGEAIPASTK
jgi:alpha-tubulin suppressor-like RCC1 family protein